MGWRDLMLERITDDDSGGGFTDNFFTRSVNRRGKYPGVSDPISDLGPLGDASAFEGRNQEKPISSIVEPWRPSSNRRSGMVDDDEGPAMTNYLRHIETAPDLNTGDYNPSVWRRMLAGLAGGAVGGAQGGLAGIKAASEINNEPYKRAVQNYQIKGEALESAARLEDVRRKTRQAYEKQITDAEDKDADREVKWANSEISRIRAEQGAKRIALDTEIKRATNQIAVDRLEAEKKKWEDQAENEIARLEILKTNAGANVMRAGASVTSANAASRNADTNAVRGDAYASGLMQDVDTRRKRGDAYTGYMGRLGTPKPPSAASRGISRRIVEDEIKNLRPDLFDTRTGALIPEKGPEYERLIQARLLGTAATADDNPWVPEPK